MKTRFLGAACGCAFTLVVSLSANAALVDRGGGLIYDTDLNITWLADAYYAVTSGFDADGIMTWSDAMTWAANLSYYDSVRNVTYTDWRLPNSDSTCIEYNCTGSEMGHLFYAELGGAAGIPIMFSNDPDLALFTPVPHYSYWSSTEVTPETSYAWNFSFNFGLQGVFDKSFNYYAWAVRPGDVAAVPLPGAVWLFGSGLLGLLGVARRKTA